jgi:uroporphyrinogen-III synthase
MRIVLTHAAGRFEGLAAALQRRGHTVAQAPLIATRPRTGDDVRAAAAALLALPWLLFTSRSAVEAWSALAVGWQPAGAPATDAPPAAGPADAAPLLGAVGRPTASALRAAGAEPALVAERSSRAAGLADAFLRHPQAAGPVGLPQGDRALPTLRRALERAGFETRPLVLYETVTQPWSGDAGEADGPVPERTADPELVVLASPSAADALPSGVAAHAALVAIGPTTAAALARRGLACRQARSPSVGGVLDAVDALAAGDGHDHEGGRA